MSGIAGIVYFNNRPVLQEQLQAMGAVLAHRGPDGISHYCKGSIGLVHCMLHDTPESLLEVLPNRTENDRFVLTFNGRIDNRKELYDRIGWGKPLSEVTDSDLVLGSYQKWRSKCVDYLLGDFAIALWDQSQRKMFCARDHMGVKPFYYYLSETFFAFASEIKGLMSLPEVPRIMNEERVADYLTSIVLDNKSTFYKDIFRLPPGHFLEIHPRRTSLVRYHEFSPARLHCKTSIEYEELFRETFADAVRVRLRSAFPVGSYLSGGLDSASIVCTAAGLFEKEIPGKLHTFSGIFNEISACDERKYFSSVLERYGVTSHTLPVDTINPAIAYEKLMHDEDEPFFAPHVFMSMGLLPLMKSAGVRILLDGHDGDSAVSYGYSLLAKLALSGNLIELVDRYKQSGVNSFKSIIKSLLLLYWDLYCKNTPIFFPFSSTRRDVADALKKLNTDFAGRTGIKARLIFAAQVVPLFGQKEGVYHLKNITQPVHPYALEFLERVAMKEGITNRYPYFDKRVIELCLALPVEEKFQKGLNRSIVRRALADLLPESIKERRKKTEFSPSLLHAFRENDRGWLLENIDIITKSNYDILNNTAWLSSVVNYTDGSFDLRRSALRDLLLLILFFRWKSKTFR